MDPVTRRSFLVKGSAGAAGAAAAFGAGWTISSAGDNDDALSQGELKDLKGPVVAHVTDAAAGKIDLLVGEQEVTVTDKGLAARLLRASKS
jgi:hypothetical protein